MPRWPQPWLPDGTDMASSLWSDQFEQFFAASVHFSKNYLTRNHFNLAGVDFIKAAFDLFVPGSRNSRFIFSVFLFDTLVNPIGEQKALIRRKREHEFFQFLERGRHSRIVARLEL